MLFYLISYDIPCNKRRKKLSDLLEGYGQRVQFSVFECRLTGQQYRELHDRLKSKINITEDSLRIYPISGHTIPQIITWGGMPLLDRPSSVIV
jgi:CRISPR-associated protein Cas2